MARAHLRTSAPLSAVALAAALLLAPAAWAQAPAAETAPAPQAGAALPPASIPYSEIPVRAEETLRRLHEIEARLGSGEPLESLAHQLRARAHMVDNASRNTARLMAEGSSLQNLGDAEREWLARGQDLDTWRELLAKRSQARERDQQRLDAAKAVWLATREAAEKRRQEEGETTADPGLQWIDRVLAAIAATRTQVNQQEQALIERQAEVAAIQARIDTRLSELREAQAERRRRLFVPDSPPLWRARPAADRASELAAVREDWEREVQAAGTYLESNRRSFALHLSMLVAALVAALAVRRRLVTWSAEDPDLGEAATALRRPVSVALIIGLLSGVWIHPLAPSFLSDLSGLVLLAPAVRVLTPLIAPVYRMPLYAVTGFYLASQLRGLLDAATFLPRVLLTAELLGAIAFLVWLRRPARLASIEPGDPLLPYLRAGVPVLFAVMVLALLADVFGYVALARILAWGGLRSIWAALVLFAAHRVLRACVRVLLRTSAARLVRSVRTGAPSIERWVERGLMLVLSGIWVVFTLRGFTIDTLAFESTLGLLTADFELGTAAFSLSDVLAFVGTLLAAWLLARFVRFLLEEDVYPRLALARGVPNAISTVVQYALLFAGLLLALAAAGLDLSRITLLAGAFGVGIGFGLQNIVNNFVSGLILLFERPIQVGDTIEIAGLTGEVRRIGPRSSTVRTADGAEVIVPNASLISDQVTNWTLSDRRRRITVTVGVAYGTDPERVLALLRQVAADTPSVLPSPEPVALFTGFGASSLDFELSCWISQYEGGRETRSDLSVALCARLAAAGIEIPFPQSDVHVRSVADPAAAALSGSPPRDEPPR